MSKYCTSLVQSPVLQPLKMLKRKLQSNATPIDLRKPKEIATEESHSGNLSKYFSNTTQFPQSFIDLQLELNSALDSLSFKPPVVYQYNPVKYAFKGNQSYVQKYCRGPKKILMVGMNPGPFGMCQTGVPFGDVKHVRDWLGICEEIGKPEMECPNRPVLGFDCKRSEVSGDRFWGLFRRLCGTPEAFFRNAFVYNYCPLAFMKADGCNVTPRDMKGEQKQLEAICDQYYHRFLQLLRPEIVIGIGEYAESRTLATLKAHPVPELGIKVIRLPHPSPRSPNNQNWAEKAETFLQTHGLVQYFSSSAQEEEETA